MAMLAEDSKIMSMANTDLIWSLYPDRFVTFGNELKLYVVDTITELPQMFGGIKLSELCFSQILTSKSEFRFVKSMACNNRLLKHGADVLYALGYQNGKIVLNSFDSSSGKESDAGYHYSNVVGKEFIQEYPRSCNALDFCQIDNNLLASGFERNKDDYSVMIWDIAHTGINYNQAAQSATITGTTKPLHQSAPNDQVHSLRWFRNRSLICGMNNKHIKLIDAKESPNQGPCVFTKGVYGITPDTHTDYRFASFFENFIYVWDLRFFESPLVTIGPEPSSFVKLEWCPTRSNILAALLKDTNSIRLYDHKQYTNFNEFPEPSILKRDITPFEVNNSQILSSFSWHPTNEFQMTVITSNGVIRDFKVVDRITLNWSPISEIIWTHGKKILQCIDSRDSIYKEIDDIAVRMRKLAIDGYGLSAEKLWDMFCKDNPLHFVWKWIYMHINRNDPKNQALKSSNEEISYDIFALHNTERFFGVMGILFEKESPKNLRPSELILSNNFPAALSKKEIYVSFERSKALQYCGWSDRHFSSNSASSFGFDELAITSKLDSNIPCDYFISINENEHNYTRLAAIMVFNGRVSEAIEYLNRASDFASKNSCNNHKSNDLHQNGKQTDKAVSLNAIALALSTFITTVDRIDKSNGNLYIWEEICSKLKPKLDDPYIKAIFNFVSVDCNSDVGKYSEIIYDEKLDIADRVAFACLYLPDTELTDFLFRVQNNLIEKNDLRAILFTGLTEDGLELFRRYIESTSDVQTISLILLWTLPHSLCKIPIVKIWIDNYKQLLDCWRLWNVRAQFDLKWYESMNYLEEPRQQIYIVCNYCRSPISTYTHTDSNTKSPISHPQPISHHQYNRASSANSSSNKLRICSCSNCGKTLPRCSLCLTQLGTPAGFHWRPGIILEKSNRKLSPFSSWFTWCQTCRHGGHSVHLLDWFTENTICPVAGCKCKCMGLDANARPIF
ncbi:GATOR complex protein mio [Dermatophagoides pteronyssinus]|uniref:GATOR complex protein mio n=1 Tax=Dermatophagoides pteronyssinus TaxID=6956 RepID=UPI003F673D45